MRTELLGELTGRFVIQRRNNEYRVFNRLKKVGDVFDCSKWGSYEKAVLIRRKWILAEARLNYKIPKSINLRCI